MTALTALTRSIKVGDLAAYVEDKKRHNGFQKEFAVSVLVSLNMALIVHDVIVPYAYKGN